MEVVCEEVLSRADDNFGDSNDMDILKLGNFGKHLGDLAKVAHVDPAVVDRVRQRLAVHGGGAVVEAVPDEGWDLNGDKEVGGILDQLALLLQLTLVLGVDDPRGEDVRVEPDVELGLLETSHSLSCLLDNLLGAVLHLRLAFKVSQVTHDN